MPGNFFDTNVLVYLASDPQKAAQVRALLNDGGTISVQVLNEIANVTRRKLRFSWDETLEFLTVIKAALSITPVTVAIHQTGLRLAERHRLSVYDAMIAAAALEANCDTLWSEDMHDRLMIDGRLTVANPFRAAM